MNLPSITDYLSPSEVLGICKMAKVHTPRHQKEENEEEEEVPKVRDWGRIARIAGVSALGMAAGTAGGFGIGALADHLHGGRIPSATLQRMLPGAILGTGAALAYSLWKDREAQEMQNAVKPDPNYKPAGK